VGILTPIGNLNLCALSAIERRPDIPLLFGMTDRHMVCVKRICEDKSNLFEFCDDPFSFVTLNVKYLRQTANPHEKPEPNKPAANDLLAVHGAMLLAADALLSGGRTDICARLGLTLEGATILRAMLMSPKEYLFAPSPWFVVTPMLIEKLASTETELFSTRLGVLAKTLDRETA